MIFRHWKISIVLLSPKIDQNGLGNPLHVISEIFKFITFDRETDLTSESGTGYPKTPAPNSVISSLQVLQGQLLFRGGCSGYS